VIAVLLAMLRRDLLLAVRQRGDVVNVLVFFLVVVTLMPLGVGPEMRLLRMIGAGCVWVAALLASILSLQRLFAQDHADGSLEQLLLCGQPLALLVVGKIVAHWLVTGALLAVAALPLSLFFDLPADAARALLISLLLGTPALSLLGAIGAALTLGLRGGGVLVSLLVLPLTTPVIIFGAGAVDAVSGGLPPEPHYLLLGGLSAAAAALAPWAISAALRIAQE
jgi:heme exporter protein B